jgi:hypothetical protein
MGRKSRAKGIAGIQFTCEHCGKVVPWARFEGEDKPRNHCPFCLWSKHVSIGAELGYPPCGGMMEPTRTGKRYDPSDWGSEIVKASCLGCGFMISGPTDDYMFRVIESGLRDCVTFTVSSKKDD